ncbi:MAG TPA: Rnf-Nqr domain containing protein [Mesotoga sp.]|jgi:Na+-transporting NADH:ubiquinone oxidoreductase subunit E|nr:NADH:ubiquinone reductase (Na(+)-transporting) subunit E [Mesotoga sp.]MDI9376142.1 Rnf-Nqr domain containing protein [Thermotogota bacterium]NLX34038.1 NADH:ubiquinone reductase (Na(+)-transporting) subunit E [Thermotogaceae bacterium]MDD4039742.1 Rnf-Nqr domain containing protein [Mesotoga sp.]MDD4477516.1 Rnf-Nqr domain containing protein [Mesotoga sp.]
MGVPLNPFVIMVAAALTSNMVLSNFLGMCSFIAVSKDIKTANGLGMAVTFVLTLTSVLNYLVYYYILVPLELVYLRYIVFIIVIAAFVQFLEMLIDRFSPSLYMNLGIFLPLITVNCAILGGVLFMIIRDYNLMQSLFFGFGSGAGWWLAIVALSTMRMRLREKDIPPQLVGPGLTMIIIGIMALAFLGFSGMVPVQ